MKEYFVVIYTFPAPIVGDELTEYSQGDTPGDALMKAVNRCKHPSGVEKAVVYNNADEFHKRKRAMTTWVCHHRQTKQGGLVYV